MKNQSEPLKPSACMVYNKDHHLQLIQEFLSVQFNVEVMAVSDYLMRSADQTNHFVTFFYFHIGDINIQEVIDHYLIQLRHSAMVLIMNHPPKKIIAQLENTKVFYRVFIFDNKLCWSALHEITEEICRLNLFQMQTKKF
jgi:hypothetical protein